jgi:hypothetical protein
MRISDMDAYGWRACFFLVVLGKAKSTWFPLWMTVAPASFTQLLCGQCSLSFSSIVLRACHRDWAGKANER